MVLFELHQALDPESPTIPKQTLSMIDQSELSANPKSNQTFLVEINNLIVTLKPNKYYLLIPATYQPAQEGKFILTASMDQKFQVVQQKEPLLDNAQVIRGRFDHLPRPIEDPLQAVDRVQHTWFHLHRKSSVRIQLHCMEEVGLKLSVYEIKEGEMKLLHTN